MLSPYLFAHFDTWTIKVNSIQGNDLASVYDKYMTLFVIYNNLYNHVPEAMINRGVPLPTHIPDNKLATEYVIRYLSPSNLLDRLIHNGNDNDIQSIIELIDNEEFYIKLNYGQRQRKEDLRILSNLRSSNLNNKAIAVLQVCYYVRCNIFHGSKDFQEHQRLLIVPLTNILQTITSLLFHNLSNE